MTDVDHQAISGEAIELREKVSIDRELRYARSRKSLRSSA